MARRERTLPRRTASRWVLRTITVLTRQEIHERITKIGYDQCKVYINSIDSQSSANGGVIIQVLGEMSNAGGPYRKFAQTFFLAQQPNGYFVLNDIFRYLKEDSDEEEEHDIEDAAPVTAAPAQQADADHAQSVPAAPVAIQQEEQEEAPKEVVEQEPEEAAPVEHEPVVEAEAPASKTEEVAEDEAEPQQPEVAAPAAPVAEKAPTANGSEPAVSGATTPAPAPAAPAAPAKPKSWASLAAGGKAWSSTVAAATPAPAAAAPKKAEAAAAPASTPPAPAAAATPAASTTPAASSGRHPYYENALKVQTPHCFVKLPNWSAQEQSASETMDENALKAIAARFGEVAKVEIVKGKACAFVEFAKVDGARKAIIASLGTHQGGEGGVASDFGKLNFETRKEKDERGPKGRRGAAPEAGRGAREGARVGGGAGGEAQRGQNAGRGRGRGRGGANNGGGDRQSK